MYTFTMDPTPQEDSKGDKERTALSRSLNSLALAVQSSAFGGLGSLAHDLTLTENGTLNTARYASRCSVPDAPLNHLQIHQQPQPVISATFFDHQTENQQQRPWYKKKYRIIVQEISGEEDDNSYSDPNVSDTTTERLNTLTPESVSTLPKSGSVSSSSPAMPPSLLDWLLFTTHEDSFFRHLGQAHTLAKQTDHRMPDVVAVNDTNALPHVDALPTATPVVTPSQAAPESACDSQSNIAMALATEISHSATPMSETPNDASVQTFGPTPVMVHKQQGTTTGTTSVRSNGFEGEHAQDASIPRKVDFEGMDLQTPWWKKRQHREQERQPWISNQNDTPAQTVAKDETKLQRAEETLDRPNLRRRLQGKTVEQPKTLETFVKTTVSTRPDGAIESKTVKVSTLLKEPQEQTTPQDLDHGSNGRSSRHGWFRRHHYDRGHMGPQTMVETETRVKIVHPDGSVEETVSFSLADNPSACVRPSARTRCEHRHHLRQQERERREQVWQAQQERQQRQREQLEQHEQRQHEQLQQQEQLRQQQEQEHRSSEPNVKNDTHSLATRSKIRERWARHRQDNQDSDQDEPSSSRSTRSRSWPPKGYLRRLSQSEQAEPHSDDQRHDTESPRATWPPKGYLRRQEREQ
ncbi:hypothetical protein BGZ81_010082 [Podila clonocystis]|nr:hypothetical protein BGZ81_010082 [Podila clonocystis]